MIVGSLQNYARFAKSRLITSPLSINKSEIEAPKTSTHLRLQLNELLLSVSEDL